MKRFLSLLLLTMLAIPTSLNAQSDPILRVMSYNIRMGSANDGTNSWTLRYQCTGLMLEDQKPDIFGLQEALPMQMNFLKENFKDYKSIGVGRDDGKEEGECMAIFFNKKRFVLKDWGTYWLSETPDVPSKGWDAACKRTATWALFKCKKTGKSFFFVNTHLDHVSQAARENGLKLIASRIAEMNPDKLPMFLTGDFNVTPDNNALNVIGETMKDARTTADRTDDLGSFNGWGKVKEKTQIDYIFYSGCKQCCRFETITKPYGGHTFISDHFPVIADFVL